MAAATFPTRPRRSDPSPLPLVGEADSAEGRARGGGAGHGARRRRRARPVQPQGEGRTDRLGLAPAADARRTGVDEEPYARRPLLARPSAKWVPSPTRGEGKRAARWKRVSREGRARGGRWAWNSLPTTGLQSFQPQGPGLTDRVGLTPAADAGRAGFDREPYARRPPPCPPPQGTLVGKADSASKCMRAVALRERDFSAPPGSPPRPPAGSPACRRA